MRKVLVVGSNGMLAHDLLARLESVLDPACLYAADLPELDITQPAKVKKFLGGLRPEVIINCAAFTDVDGCEQQRDLAMAVNGEGAGNLADAANDVDALLMHLSTDFVFDGTKAGAYLEEDEPRPVSVYGESKLEGERRVQSRARDHVIVRTAWLFGPHGRSFPRAILEKARSASSLEVVDDQRGCPTYTVDLAEALVRMMDKNIRGVVHAAGSGSCTWFEFAQEICRQAGLDVRIEPITSDRLNRPARRPANSVLDSSRLTELTGFEFPTWRRSLGDFLRRVSF